MAGEQRIEKRTVWSDKQLALARHLCLPETLRAYKDITQLAEVLGVGRSTLYTWMDRPDWNELMQQMARQVMLDLSPEFLASLATDMLSRGNDKAHMAYWRYVYPQILEEKNRGYLEAAASSGTSDLDALERRRMIAVQRASALPPDQQEVLLEILVDMGHIADTEALNTDESAKPVYNVKARGEDGASPQLPPAKPRLSQQRDRSAARDQRGHNLKPDY